MLADVAASSDPVVAQFGQDYLLVVPINTTTNPLIAPGDFERENFRMAIDVRGMRYSAPIPVSDYVYIDAGYVFTLWPISEHTKIIDAAEFDVRGMCILANSALMTREMRNKYMYANATAEQREQIRGRTLVWARSQQARDADYYIIDITDVFPRDSVFLNGAMFQWSICGVLAILPTHGRDLLLWRGARGCMRIRDWQHVYGRRWRGFYVDCDSGAMRITSHNCERVIRVDSDHGTISTAAYYGERVASRRELAPVRTRLHGRVRDIAPAVSGFIGHMSCKRFANTIDAVAARLGAAARPCAQWDMTAFVFTISNKWSARLQFVDEFINALADEYVAAHKRVDAAANVVSHVKQMTPAEHDELTRVLFTLLLNGTNEIAIIRGDDNYYLRWWIADARCAITLDEDTLIAVGYTDTAHVYDRERIRDFINRDALHLRYCGAATTIPDAQRQHVLSPDLIADMQLRKRTVVFIADVLTDAPIAAQARKHVDESAPASDHILAIDISDIFPASAVIIGGGYGADASSRVFAVLPARTTHARSRLYVWFINDDRVVVMRNWSRLIMYGAETYMHDGEWLYRFGSRTIVPCGRVEKHQQLTKRGRVIASA